MADWFQGTLTDSFSVPWQTLVVRLSLALVSGGLVAGVYRATRWRAPGNSSFPATLVLLCVLIAVVTQVIGDNVARAFSLVGALSIVRFRTVVQDTKDTAFVIFAVVMGMAIGAGQYPVALCGMGAVGTAAAIFRDRAQALLIAPRETRLSVRMGWSPESEGLVLAVLGRHASRIEPRSAATVRQGAALELCYAVQLSPQASLSQLVGELNRIEGMQSVELRNQREEAS